MMSAYPKLFVSLALACSGLLSAQNIPNPVIPGVADAGAMKHNGKYYVGGVHTYGDFYVSDDLVHWSRPVHVVTMDNDWTRGTGAGNNQIHANDMVYLNGMFHLYWSVNYWGKDRHAVHMVHAQSPHALGPYAEPDRKTWLDNRIDPKLFQDDDGTLYMYNVRFTEGNTIWARKMKNPAQFAGDPVCQFAALPGTWETMDNKVAEGPWVMKYRDRYYMMYNANHTGTDWGNYQLGVAEADSPLSFQQGNKYSYPVVGSNRTYTDDTYIDLLRYGTSFDPLFAYTETRPADGWTEARFDDAAWRRGASGFAAQAVAGSTTRHQGTPWQSDALWLRKSFDAPRSAGNLALRVAHDGDTRIYLNGTLIYDHKGRDYRMVNLDPKQRRLLREGRNLLAVETNKGRSAFFDVALFDMKNDVADDILMTPGQPNILRGPNGFEWWLIYMANKNNEPRSQYINRVKFFDKTLFVDGITGPRTPGYHPLPSLPTWASQGEVRASGVITAQPSAGYLFESGVNTASQAGIIAYWKDERNAAYVGLDADTRTWYLRTIRQGQETQESFPLPADFRFGVYHHLRIERQGSKLSVWIDHLPAPGKHSFAQALPAREAALPGLFALDEATRFEGAIYTIGTDNESFRLAQGEQQLRDDRLTDYELSFQLSRLQADSRSGCYPVYVDQENYVKALFNASTRSLEVEAVRGGKQLWHRSISLAHRRTHYTDVKYTDMVEKTYCFDTPVTLDALYLSRHECDNRAEFVDDMFSRFHIEYQAGGEWHPLEARAAVVDAHPAYNRLDLSPVKAEALRFINREPTDLRHHIYKLGVNEVWKDSYNFCAMRRGGKLYFWIDGREIAAFDIDYPASRVGFCAEQGEAQIDGMLYYHIRDKK